MSDVEVLARVEQRRKWTQAEKAALLAEVDAAGSKIRTVARRHGISERVLYNWRSAKRAAQTCQGIIGPESPIVSMEVSPRRLVGGECNHRSETTRRDRGVTLSAMSSRSQAADNDAPADVLAEGQRVLDEWDAQYRKVLDQHYARELHSEDNKKLGQAVTRLLAKRRI